MKPQERAARMTQGSAQGKPATGEWDGRVVSMGDDFMELEENTDKAVVDSEPARSEARPAATLREPTEPRERRRTLVSSIPAQLARSMMGDLRPAGAPATAMVPAVKRRIVADSELDFQLRGAVQAPSTEAYSAGLVDDSPLPPQAQVEALIVEARSFMDHGNLGAAVIAADQVLVEAAKAPLAEVAELVKAARPLFDRIFAAYLGLLGQVPVRARTDEQLAGQELGERTNHLLAGVDGVKTLEQLAASTGIPPVEALKIAASLLAAGIVRTA